MARITIDNTTSLARLREFARDIDSADTKIKAKDLGGGRYELYSTSGSANFLENLIGRRNRRIDRTEAAIVKVFDNTRTRGKGDKFEAVKNLLAGTKTRSLRADTFKDLLLAASGIEKRAGKKAPTAEPPHGPTIAGSMPANGALLKGRVGDLAGAVVLNGPGSPQATAKIPALIDQLASAYVQENPSTRARQDFMLSSGTAMQAELVEIMSQASDRTVDATLKTQFVAVARDVVNQVAAKMSPDRVIAATDTAPRRIEIGGETYSEVRKLGDGGFGTAFEFKADTGDKRVAVKFPNNPGSVEAFTDFSGEIAAHKQAVGADGHANVIGFEGAIRTPGGDLVIVSELADHGNVHEANEKLDALVEAGSLDAPTARILKLTMLKDMFAGMRHLRREGDLTHRDLKPANAFIGGDGQGKIADFGTTTAGAGFNVADVTMVDNPVWKSPELIFARSKFESRAVDIETDVEAAKTQRVADRRLALVERFAPDLIDRTGQTPTYRVTDLPADLKTAWQNIGHGIQADHAETTREAFGDRFDIDGTGSDVWALGVSALEMLTEARVAGEDRHGHSVAFGTGREQFIAAFPTSGRDAVGSPDAWFADLAGEDPEVVEFLNKLLSADPTERGTFTEALSHPVFSRPGVGSPEARTLLKAAIGLELSAEGKVAVEDQIQFDILNLDVIALTVD